MRPREMYKMLKDAQADIMLSGGRSQFVALKAKMPWLDINQERHHAYAGYDGMVELVQEIDKALSQPDLGAGAQAGALGRGDVGAVADEAKPPRLPSELARKGAQPSATATCQPAHRGCNRGTACHGASPDTPSPAGAAAAGGSPPDCEIAPSGIGAANDRIAVQQAA